jgi:hypothetical protein
LHTAADAERMSLVRPIGYGLLAFPVVVGVTFATYPTTVLLAGAPVGLLVGYASDGWLAGFRNGLLAGVAIAVLTTTVGYYVATAPDRLAPGVGITILLIALAGVVIGVQSTLAAGFGGLLNR